MMRWGENLCGAFASEAFLQELYQPILHLA